MKNYKNYLACLSVFALLFTSCSKEESALPDEEATAIVSFSTMLNDVMATKSSSKQSLDEIPECSDDAPAFVDVVLSERVNGNSVEVVGTVAAPLRLAVSSNPGDYDGDGIPEYFTEEHSDLELPMGRYYLDYFVVRNSSQQVIWVAPTSQSDLGNFVTNALPIPIDLEAGVKEYVDVEVLCYDERMVRKYGYLFFDIHGNEALQYCFFANYCDPNGRHFSASYVVDVWTLNDDGSRDYIYEDEANFADINEDDETFAEPLCLILPNLTDYEDGEDYIFYEVRLLDWIEDGAYGNINEEVHVITGSLSRNDIVGNYVSETVIDYEHLRFGCEGEPGGNTNPCPGTGDTDEDGIGNACDNCENTPNRDQDDTDGDGIGDACEEPGGNTNPCPGTGDTDEDGIGNACDNCENTPNTDQDDTDGDGVGDACEEPGGNTNPCPGTGDTDEDGIGDACDNCEDIPNNGQEDSDNDGIGDVCDETGEPGDCDETAFMYGNTRFSTLDLGNKRWGWANEFTEDDDFSTEFQFYAGAGQYRIESADLAGVVSVSWDSEEEEVVVNIDLDGGVTMDNVHIYFSDVEPTTSAPGLFGKVGLIDGTPNPVGDSYVFPSEDGYFWLIVHAEVCVD